MSAYEELHEGLIGNQSARLLYGVVRAVAIDNRFPAPAGYDRWDDDAIVETSHQFLADDGAARMRKAAVLATDDRSLVRVLQRVVRNWFSDQARQTVKGRLARAIAYRLERMPDVVALGGSGSGQMWVHTTGSGDQVRPPMSTLVEAAYAATPGAAARLALDPRRGAALIEPAALEILLRAVLVAAAGPVDTGTLVEVVTARFPVIDTAPTLPLQDAMQEPEHSTPVADIGAVERIWLQLTHDERRAISVIELPVRSMAEALGLRRSTAHRLAARTRAILTEGTTGRADAAEIAAELYARSIALWSEASGTGDDGLASSKGTGGDE